MENQISLQVISHYMLEFPITEIYRRVAKFDVIDEDKKSKVGSGCGFFYLCDDKAFFETKIFFVTKRSYVAIEEHGFLPDSIILHIPTDSGMDTVDISLKLYDNEEKPVWRVLSQELESILISIPLPSSIQVDYRRCFLSQHYLPTLVYLRMHDGTLNIPARVCLSVAEYIFYSDAQNEQSLQKMIEKGDGFRINRKGFARDMIEMILVLLQHNLEELAKSSDGGKCGNSTALHYKLVSELEKVIIQFGDALEPSIFEKVQNIFAILREHNLEDYLAVRHLIRKVLLLLGQDILFVQ